MARKAKLKPNENVTYSGHTGECSLFIDRKGQYIYRNNPVVDLRNAAGELIAKSISVTHVERLPEPITNSILRGTTEQVIDDGTNPHYVEPKPYNKYDRVVKDTDGNSVVVDVYSVLDGFNVTCPALQHLIKKALCVGIRGHKDTDQDLQDINASAIRAIQLNKNRNQGI